MRIAVIVVLCMVWIVLAYRAYERGDTMLAGVFVLVGAALTIYRVSRLRG